MKENPPLSTSPEITEPARRMSDEERRAASEFRVSLKYGVKLLRPMVTRLLKEGLNVPGLYQRAVEEEQWIRGRNLLPPLVVPTWDELDPNRPEPV